MTLSYSEQGVGFMSRGVVKSLAASTTSMAILEALRQNSVDGKVKMSVRDLSQITGHSHATVHRALQRLRFEGWIDILPSDKVNEPDTIVIKREPDTLQSLTEKLTHVMQQMEAHMEEALSIIPVLYQAVSATRSLKPDEMLSVLRDAVASCSMLPGNLFNVVFDLSKLPPDVARYILSLRREE